MAQTLYEFFRLMENLVPMVWQADRENLAWTDWISHWSPSPVSRALSAQLGLPEIEVPVAVLPTYDF